MRKILHEPEIILETVEKVIDDAQKEIDTLMTPVRRSVFSRFPVLFTLLVTFGVSATFLGFEQMIVHISYLYERPWLILSLGVLVLILTGTLYKKLG